MVIGCFQGRPQLRFIVGLMGLVSSLGASRVDGGASNSSSPTVASGSSSSAVTSSLSSLTSWVVSGQK